MTNEQRAERLIKDIGFDLDKIPKEYITELLENEINDFHEGSSEYILTSIPSPNKDFEQKFRQTRKQSAGGLSPGKLC